MSEETIVNCPACGKNVIWDEQSPFCPFCSKRRQLIDLGEWIVEERCTPGAGDLSNGDDRGERQPRFTDTPTR